MYPSCPRESGPRGRLRSSRSAGALAPGRGKSRDGPPRGGLPAGRTRPFLRWLLPGPPVASWPLSPRVPISATSPAPFGLLRGDGTAHRAWRGSAAILHAPRGPPDGHTFGCWGWDANVSFPGTHLGPSQGMKVAAKEFESGKGSIKLIKASPPHPPVPAACGGRGLWGNDQPDPAHQSAELPARRGA